MLPGQMGETDGSGEDGQARITLHILAYPHVQVIHSLKSSLTHQ